MRPPLKSVLIGCGHISERHVPAWQASPDAELVAVCDLDRARAEARAKQFGIERVYTDVEMMLDAERPDCVDIATHDVTHTALVSVAVQRGIPTLCQKPLAPTMAEARAMVELAKAAGVRFMVMEMWRHSPIIRDVKRYLDQEIIGPVHALRCLPPPRQLRWTRPIDDQQPYLADLPKLMVYDTYIHHIDGIRYLLGDVDSVYARMSHTNPAIVGEDRLTLVMGHANGATSLIDASWTTPLERSTKLMQGDFLIDGRDGSLHLDPFDAELRLLAREGGPKVTVLERYEPGRPLLQAAFNSCIGDFAASVRHDRPFESSADDNLKTLAITLASYESVSRGTVVRPDDAP